MAFDFDAAVQAPFRMQPGLRRLPEGARQLTPVTVGSRHLREKLAVLGANWPTALQCMAGFDPRAALTALARQAAVEHPEDFGWDGETATARRLGWAVRGDAVAPADDPGVAADAGVGQVLHRLAPGWRLAALIALSFAEDFAVIDGRSAVIPWLAVALPSSWAPQDKIGRHFAQVHAPVADSQMLLAAADALARLVAAPTRWERFVWTLTPNPNLDAHPARRAGWCWSTGSADDVAAQAWWRTERQTFIPLEGQAQAVFTILVDTQPLAAAIDSAARARRLHDALSTMSAAVLRYRGLTEARAPLLQWLTRRAHE
jgi:hypothetical protein